jgi:hypothetical protein
VAHVEALETSVAFDVDGRDHIARIIARPKLGGISKNISRLPRFGPFWLGFLGLACCGHLLAGAVTPRQPFANDLAHVKIKTFTVCRLALIDAKRLLVEVPK